MTRCSNKVGADDAAAVVGKGRGGVLVVGVVGVPCAWQSSAKGRRKDRVGGGIVVRSAEERDWQR